ncbi:uncharacterized protein LOC125647075 isoform X2 [Ostrea edulis]|uniref:uncharacterized protein LOC125647075 isoform X2 n=1 Tax=Ostrea edulis TaxID=37623 RepID=UPI0024AF0FE9|nr:uncharacterized protein LOC125647075 isoform X2 [Ostrea edulis]
MATVLWCRICGQLVQDRCRRLIFGSSFCLKKQLDEGLGYEPNENDGLSKYARLYIIVVHNPGLGNNSGLTMTTVFVYVYTLLLMTFCGHVKSLQCPLSASDWQRASQALQCKPPNYYHCLRDENGATTEQCLSKVWIQKGMCPEYNSRVSRIDVFQCSSSNCPPSLYWSNAVFIYPICFETSKPTAATTKPISEQEMDEGALSISSGSVNGSRRDATSNSFPTPAIVGIIIGITIVIVVSAVTVTLLYKRRSRGGKQKNLVEESGGEDLEKMSQTRMKKGVENEEGDVNETGTLLDKGSPEDTNESPTGSSLVYVVEGPEHVPGADPLVRIFVVVVMASISKGKLKSEAQKIFGPECKLLSVSCFQEQSKEKYETLFTEDFNVNDDNSLQILQKLREVVAVNKQDAKFVVRVPFSFWEKQRDDIMSMLENDLVFKSVYC